MALSEELQRKADAMDKKDIICPYCFKKFKDNKVIFRANYVYRGKKSNRYGSLLLDTDDDEVGGTDDPDKKLFTGFHEVPYTEGGKRDRELEDFWEKRGGGDGFTPYDETWFHPHIDPSKDTFPRMIRIDPHNKNMDNRGFIRDDDGFVRRVQERYRGDFDEVIRLCPKCHNPLPFATYGKYDVCFISIVGIKGSGKTVYLNQLLMNFVNALVHTGYIMAENTLTSMINVRPVDAGHPFPPSTDDKVMRRPSAVTMKKTVNTKDDRSITLVFYDIAGENCLEDESRDQKTNAAAVARFLGFSDGLVFLIDPEQVPAFNTAEDVQANMIKVQSAINRVIRLRVAHNFKEQTWDNVPVAVTLTKSDMLPKEFLAQHPSLFSRVRYTDARGEAIQGFPREEFYENHRELEREFRENAPLIDNALSGFRRKAYFSVSAVSCGVVYKFQKYGQLYRMDAAAFRTMVRVREWLENWDAQSAENRRHFGALPLRDKDGKTIELDPGFGLRLQNPGVIETSLVAKANRADGTLDVIHLTLKDIAPGGVEVQGYPAGKPDPKRVEEPFLWILWQLGLIDPIFENLYDYPSIPKRRPFESERRYERRMEEYHEREAAYAEDKAAFYACELGM